MLVLSLGGEDPLEKEMEPAPVFLPGRLHRQRSLVVYSPWSPKESDMTEHVCTPHMKTPETPNCFQWLSWKLE